MIAYAGFTDYEQIITRDDNWEKVFKPVFPRKTFVQESFCWIYPIRNDIAHNRIITSDDKLYLNGAGKNIDSNKIFNRTDCRTGPLKNPDSNFVY